MREDTLREHDDGCISMRQGLVVIAHFVSDKGVGHSGGRATHVATYNDAATWGGVVGEEAYLIRYGVMSHVGRFPTVPTCDQPLKRGQPVVIQTARGLEIGEVLIATHVGATPSPTAHDTAKFAPGCGRREFVTIPQFALCAAHARPRPPGSFAERLSRSCQPLFTL